MRNSKMLFFPILCFLFLLFTHPTAGSAGWELQDPLPQGNTLYGIWGSSVSDVFAVGDSGTILHYDGISWSPMTSGVTRWLTGIWGSSVSDVFAVGYSGTILHYNGISWSPMTSGITNRLAGIWGSSGSDVFAVGDSGTILHYNRSYWSPMTSGVTNRLDGIWGDSVSDVFAVGDSGTILHYDGISWSPMTSGAIDSLYGIWGSSVSDVFAVGYSGTIFHYDGISWSPMTSGATNSLYGIWGSGSYFFAVGDSGTIFHGASFLYVGSRGNCGTKEPCYSKIQDAIDNAANGFVILVKRGTYEESLNMGSSKTLLIKGGYNEAYDQQAANTTIIQASGPTTIKSSGGSLKFEMINVE